jgi:hypothetical protein
MKADFRFVQGFIDLPYARDYNPPIKKKKDYSATGALIREQLRRSQAGDRTALYHYRDVIRQQLDIAEMSFDEVQSNMPDPIRLDIAVQNAYQLSREQTLEYEDMMAQEWNTLTIEGETPKARTDRFWKDHRAIVDIANSIRLSWLRATDSFWESAMYDIQDLYWVHLHGFPEDGMDRHLFKLYRLEQIFLPFCTKMYKAGNWKIRRRAGLRYKPSVHKVALKVGF